LESYPETRNRHLMLGAEVHPSLKEAGISVVEVEHEGCVQTSCEEADVVNQLIGSLLRQRVARIEGSVRAVEPKDILVVAPFNAQVNLLKRKLPKGIRVGTVDKFQGDEAPVAIVSMATSNGADAPRGTQFLFSRNRLNVAVSRAQCLAIIVRGARLLDLSPTSVDDLERLDGFARTPPGPRQAPA